MFHNVPMIILLLPFFALAIGLMIFFSTRTVPLKKARSARSLRIVEPEHRSWFDHEEKPQDEEQKKRAA